MTLLVHCNAPYNCCVLEAGVKDSPYCGTKHLLSVGIYA